MKKIIGRCLMISIFICNMLWMDVSAAEIVVPDMTAMGSVSVTMKNEKEVPVSGGTLTIYPVAEAFRDKINNDYFRITEDFLAYKGFSEILGLPDGNPVMKGVESKDLESKELVDGLVSYVAENKLEGITKNIDANGNVFFTDLNLGLYLAVQNTPADGYYAVNSFLVTVPQQDDAGWIYSVDATPKVEALKEKPVEPEKPSNPSKPTGKLPQTGQLNWPVPVMLIGGVVLIMIGYGLGRSKEKK